VRHGTATTTITGNVSGAGVSPAYFDVASTAGLQAGDRIGISGAGVPATEYFCRIASISGSTITLVSPLPFSPTSGNTVNRYESIGYIYDTATNQADNGGMLASSVHFKVWPNLNGLQTLAPAEITVVKE